MSISSTFYVRIFRRKFVSAAFSSYILALAKKFVLKMHAYNVDEIDYRNEVAHTNRPMLLLHSSFRRSMRKTWVEVVSLRQANGQVERQKSWFLVICQWLFFLWNKYRVLNPRSIQSRVNTVFIAIQMFLTVASCSRRDFYTHTPTHPLYKGQKL